MAEGLVYISSLVDHNFILAAGKQQFSRSKQYFVLGDKVEVILNSVDLLQQEIGFTVFGRQIP
jgi:exoribonuclease R